MIHKVGERIASLIGEGKHVAVNCLRREPVRAARRAGLPKRLPRLIDGTTWDVVT